jgi:HAD superfamily hydrolase (TIGR01549 family)
MIRPPAGRHEGLVSLGSGLAAANAMNLAHVLLILFDVDGTLIDSNGAHAETWSQALSEYGFAVDVTRIRPLIGMGADKLLPAAAGIDHDSDIGREVAGRKKSLFATRLAQLQPTRGARQLVQYVRDLNKDVMVATSADDREMAAILERAGVADLIPRRTSKDDAPRSKPDADIVQAALGRSGVDPHLAIMVGDTPYDVDAARRAEVRSIALRCGGFWSDDDLDGAVAVLDDPAALLDRWRAGLELPDPSR